MGGIQLISTFRASDLWTVMAIRIAVFGLPFFTERRPESDDGDLEVELARPTQVMNTL